MLRKLTNPLEKLRIILESLLLLVLAVILVGRIVLSPERLKAIAERVVKNRTGAELFVEDIHYEFPNTFVAANAYLITRGEHDISVLMSVREAEYKFGFRNVPQQRFGIKEISLHNLRTFLERDEAGNWNFSSAQQRWVATGRPDASGELIDFYIFGGVIEITDRRFKKGAIRARLKDITLRPIESKKGTGTAYDFAADGVERTLGKLTAKIDVDLKARRTLIDANFTLDLAQVAERLPEEARKEWAKFSLEGPAAVDLSMRFGPAGEGLPDFSTRISLNGCSANYQVFPYEVSGLRGMVQVDRSGLAFERLVGSADPGELALSGNVSWGDTEAPGYRLHIEAKDLPLDEKLKKGLPAASQRVWNELNIQGGAANVTFDLNGVAGTMPQYSCEARFRGTAIKYSKFPLLVEGVSGAMNFSNGFLQGEDIVGRMAGDTQNEIRASITGEGMGEDFSLELEIGARSLPINEELRQVLGEAVSGVWATLRPQGRISGTFGILLPAGAEQPDVNCTLDLSQVSVSPDIFPYRFDGIYSEACYDGEKVTFSKTIPVGSEEMSRRGFLEVEGEVAEFGATPSYDLEVATYNLPLDEKLYAALPRNAKEWWTKIAPSGAVDAVVKIVEEGRERPALSVLEASLRDCAFSPLGFQLKNIEGSVTYREDSVNVERLRGRLGTIEFEAKGEAREDDGRWPWRFGFRTSEFEVGQELEKALPERYARIVGSYLESGQLVLNGSARGEGPLDEIEVRGAFTDVSVPGGLKMEKVSGEMLIAADLTEQGLDIAGRADIDAAIIAGWRLSDAHLTFDWAEAGLWLRDIKAQAYGGEIEGDIEIDTVRQRVEMDLSASSVKLENLVNEGPLSGSQTRGLVDVDMLLSANLDGTGVSGKGTARISDGYLWEIPVFTNLLEIIPLNLEKLTTFSDGFIEYELEADKVKIQEMKLASAVLAIEGFGSVGYDGSLDLTLSLRPTSEKLPIPLLEELLAVLARLPRKVIPFRIKGTFSQPEARVDVTAAPRELVSWLKKILPGRRESE